MLNFSKSVLMKKCNQSNSNLYILTNWYRSQIHYGHAVFILFVQILKCLNFADARLLHPSEIQCIFYRYLCTSDWDRDRWKMAACFLMNVNDCVFDCIITWCVQHKCCFEFASGPVWLHTTGFVHTNKQTSLQIKYWRQWRFLVICFALPCRCLERHPCVKSSQDSPRLPRSKILGESGLNVHCVFWNLVWHIEELKCVCIFGPRPSVD